MPEAGKIIACNLVYIDFLDEGRPSTIPSTTLLAELEKRKCAVYAKAL